MADVIRNLAVVLNLQNDNFIKGLRDSQREAGILAGKFKPLSTAVNDVGRVATSVGKGLTASVSLPLLAIGAASVKMASDFESSFAGVRKTVDATEGELAALSTGIRNMAKEIPVSTTELNKIAEAAGQLGIKKEDIIKFTRTMADLGVTTNLSSDQAATATAQFQNIFGAAGKDVDRFASTLVALGNAGASTEKDIIDMGLRIAGAGRQVGLTQAQTLSFASALSSVGINAEAGGSAISRVFLKINDAVAGGGKKLDEFARISGMSSAEFKTAFQTDAAGATVAFIGGLDRLKGEGENVNATLDGLVGKNIIIKDTLNRAAGAIGEFTKQLAVGDKGWQDNTAATAEAEKRYKTFESQLKTFKQRLEDVGISLGTALLPALKSMLEASQPVITILGKVADAFAALPVPAQTFIVAIAGIAAAIGPVLIGVGLLMQSGAGMAPVFLRIGATIAKLAAPITSAGGLLTGLGATLSGLAVPIAIGVAAIASVAAIAYVVYKNWDDIKPKLLAIWDAIKEGAEQIWGVIKSGIESVTTSTKEIWNKYGADIKLIWDTIKGFALDMWNRIADLAIAGIRIVSSIIANGLKAIAGVFEVALGILSGNWRMVWDGMKLIVSGAWGAIKDTVVAIFRFTLSELERLIDGVAKTANSLGSALPGFLGAPLLAVGRSLNSASDAVSDYSRSMGKGVQAANDFGKSVDGLFRPLNEQKQSVKAVTSVWEEYFATQRQMESDKAVVSIWTEYFEKEEAAVKKGEANAARIAAAQAEAANSSKAFQSAVDSLKESVIGNTDKNLQLIVAVTQLSDAHVSAGTIAKALGEPISALVDELEREGKAVPPIVRAISDLHAEQTSLKTDMIAITNAVMDWNAELNTQQRLLAAADRAIAASVKINRLYAESEREMADAIETANARLRNLPIPANDAAEALLMIKPPKVVLPESDVRKVSEQAKNFQQAWATSISNLNTRTAEALSDALISGGNFGKRMVDIAKDTAKGMLAAFLSGVIAPLTDQFAKLGQKVVSILSDTIFSKLTDLSGLTDSVLSKIPGIGGTAANTGVNAGVSAAGGGASAASSASSGVSSAASGVMGAVGAVGAVAGALAGVGVIFQLKRIEGTMNAVEANTRFTYIQLRDTMEQILWPINGLTNFIAQQASKSVELLDSISWSAMFSYQYLETIAKTLGTGNIATALATEPKSLAMPEVNPQQQAVTQTIAPVFNYDITLNGVQGESVASLVEKLKRAFQNNTDDIAAELIRTILNQQQGVIARG